MPRPDAHPKADQDSEEKAGGPVFWKITAAGASFQAGSAAVDSATIVASLVNHLTGSVYAVGAASAVLRLGWLLPQLVVGFLAQRVERRMPFYIVGAFGRASCLALIAVMFAFLSEPANGWIAGGFLLTLFSIQLVPLFVDAQGWSLAFGSLVLGPVVGVWAMLRLRGQPEALALAGGRR